MKKVIIAILIITTLILIPACNKTPVDEGLKGNVSYLETHLYTGETSDFAVCLMRGKREDSFMTDGAVTNMSEFTTLKVTPLKTELFGRQYTYKITGATGELTGTLTKDMFGVSYSAEIQNIDSIGAVASVTILSEGVEYTVELTNRLQDMLDWEEALAIAETEFAESIAAETGEDGFGREIHVKFVNNRRDRNSPYYWYVAFIASRTDYWALLIDPSTGEIVSKKALAEITSLAS